jgi:hypothetical protein
MLTDPQDQRDRTKKHSNMSEIVQWIEDAARELGRSFPRCSPEAAKEVVAAARARFVQGNPRVWWLGLSRPHVAYDSKNHSFLDVIPDSSNRVWLIAEDDSEDLPVYDLAPADVDLIRSHCPLFEYYVSDKHFHWLVIESDHDEFLVCQDTVPPPEGTKRP